jgi:Gram-negative bacterial TonB protein C-terminal
LTKSKAQILCCSLIVLLLASPSFAKEDPHDLLTKSFQQADIWTQGPVKLDAQVSLPKQGGGEVTVEYVVSWAGPDKWRAEWKAEGLQDVAVLNNGKLSTFSNQTQPLLFAMQFEAALAMLDAGNPAGPYVTSPPLDWQKVKFDSSKKKIGSVDAKCFTYGQPAAGFCLDPANAHLLSADADFTTFEYSDYTTVGSNSYPQTIKISFNKQATLATGKVTVTRGDKFDDKLFIAPDKATTVDYPSCADVDKNFTAPHLNKSVPPKMPDAAKKANKSGIVWVLATVGKDGSVTKAAALPGADPDFTAPAGEAAQQYKYTPYMRCGQAVEFQKVLLVPFVPAQQGRPQETPITTR